MAKNVANFKTNASFMHEMVFTYDLIANFYEIVIII